MAKIQISELAPANLNVLDSKETSSIIGGARGFGRGSLININDSFNTQLGINTAVIVQLGGGSFGFINQSVFGGFS
jgi:hypothetical protein